MLCNFMIETIFITAIFLVAYRLIIGRNKSEKILHPLAYKTMCEAEDQAMQDGFDREFEFNIDCMVRDYVDQWNKAKRHADEINDMWKPVENKYPVVMIYIKNPRHAMRNIIPGCKSKWDGVDIDKLVHDKAQEIIKTII